MSIAMAKAHYSGKGGRGKMNCAQAVAHAFRETYSLPDVAVASMAACGTGRAPGGECGALFAARTALKDSHPDRIEACSSAFAGKAGSTLCREIRQMKKLPCLGCVETAAAFLEKIRPTASGTATCGVCSAGNETGSELSLERQVRIMAGAMAATGAVLSWLVHPAFAAISLAIGCGLVYAGITNNCFATLLLSKLPWNK